MSGRTVRRYGQQTQTNPPATFGPFTDGTPIVTGDFILIERSDVVEKVDASTIGGTPAVAFRVYLNILAPDYDDIIVPINNGYANNGGYPIRFNQIDLDTDNQIDLAYAVPGGGGPQAAFYNPQTAFICSVPGWYWVSLKLLFKADPGGAVPDPQNVYSTDITHFNADGTFVEEFQSFTPYMSLYPATHFNGGRTGNVTALVHMTAGQLLVPYMQRDRNELSQIVKVVADYNTFFEGFLVKAD